MVGVVEEVVFVVAAPPEHSEDFARSIASRTDKRKTFDKINNFKLRLMLYSLFLH